jgi:DNA phosphorothioation-associated putative methyltransferase
MAEPTISAIIRNDLSSPVRLALEAGLFSKDTTFFDYGGGQGGDVKAIANLGYASAGCDVYPYQTSLPSADIVNLGYVINLIECPEQRQEILCEAWQITREILIVAAPILINDLGDNKIPYEPGFISNLNYSPKYYEQEELKSYIEQVLNVEAIAVSLGIYFIFRCQTAAENFLFSCFISKTPAPKLHDNFPKLLAPLIAFVTQRGRLPVEGELASEAEIIKEFGSIAQAFEVILHSTNQRYWDAIAHKRRSDILIYLAYKGTELSSPLAPEINNDIQALFGSYQQACEAAKELSANLTEPNIIANYCQRTQLGKLLPTALYIHVSAISEIDPLLRLYEANASRNFGRIDGATLIKISMDQPRISYLFYPDFDIDPHPALQASIWIDTQSGIYCHRNYSNSDNPPVLHRKETFVTPDYPNYQEFARLTREEEAWGLLDRTRDIGTKRGWQKCLKERGVEIEDHRVVARSRSETIHQSPIPKIERHRAAIVRKSISRPLRLALEANLFTKDTTFFDYGCGHGGDVARMTEQGYISAGWDPYYFPDNPHNSADIVNLGYIINVIECKDERREALLKAWELSKKVLIVASLVLIDHRETGQVAYGDGIITKRNTFQKYYEQEELKTYIDQVLNVDAVPVALGIYFVFRDESQAQAYRASRFRSRTKMPKVHTQIKRFEDYQELLAPLMEFVTERGRLPVKGEISEEDQITEEFGNIKRAFKVILQATDQQEWDAIALQRRQDLLVYIALTQFDSRPKFSELAPVVQHDIKALCSSYTQASEAAEDMLFSLRDYNIITQCCAESLIGSQRYNGFYIHVSSLSSLHPLLRLYEGCASRAIGRLDEATLIKFHTDRPKISYLFYPDFDINPHPVLHTSMQINLGNLRVSYQDYDTSDNPPILHRKETIVTPEYPNYDKLVKLTRHEEEWGLLDDERAISTLKGWQRCLQEHCAELYGYNLRWRKDADPYRIKLLKSARAARKKREKQSQAAVLKIENNADAIMINDELCSGEAAANSNLEVTEGENI